MNLGRVRLDISFALYSMYQLGELVVLIYEPRSPEARHPLRTLSISMLGRASRNILLLTLSCRLRSGSFLRTTTRDPGGTARTAGKSRLGALGTCCA